MTAPAVPAAPARRRTATRRPTLLALAAAALLLAPSTGDAQGSTSPLPACPATISTLTSPFIGLLIDGQCTDLSRAITRSTQGPMLWTASLDQVVGNTRIQIDATFDGDPFISFGITTTNFLAGPTTYSILFGTPIVPGLYTTATSSGGVSVTAGATNSSTVANSAVHPSFISGYGTNGPAATNLGVDIGTTPCTATTTTTCTYGPGSATFAPTFYDNLEALVTYTQSGANSVASWSGRVDLLSQSTVPEPATLVLLATGLLVVGGVARRKREN